MDIFEASKYGNIEQLEKLIKNMDINIQDQEGSTPLYFAADSAKFTSSNETVKWLLSHGADPNIQDKKGWTILCSIVPRTSDKNGTTLIETVKILLDNGADPNIPQEDGWTPLMWAVRYSGTESDTNTVKLLLERGANPNLVNKNKQNALMIGISYALKAESSFEAIEMLLHSGINIDAQDKWGKTALMFAVIENDDKSVELLLKAGANVNLVDESGKYALDYAKDPEIIKMLMSAGGKCKNCKAINKILEENKYVKKPYRKIRFLGKGRDGSVYEVEKNGLRYALKDIAKNKKLKIEKQIEELNLQKRLNHPNISKVFEIYEDDKNIVIIMELCQEDMKQFLKTNRLSKEQIISILKQLVSAVEYLEEKRILHKDIKVENILMCRDGDKIIPKLIDFDSAQKGEYFYGFIGYFENMAPEMCENGYGYGVNVWQLGVVLYYMLFNKSPFSELLQPLIGGRHDYCYNYIKENKIKFPNLDSKLYRLLERMLEPNPKERITLAEIKNFLQIL
jgi:ankyrin repeat protein